VSTASDPWGRVAEDGTVYVRTADGERVIGSWQAGSPDEALAFFKRKFDALETEIGLLEQRMSSTDLSAGQARSAISRLTVAITDANVIGDLTGLRGRLDALESAVEHRREEHKAAREQARNEAQEVKERIVAEAERLATEATHWKASGERMRQLLEEWKAAPRGDRATETVLWKRLSAARNGFAKRRKAYFATLEEERDGIRSRKEELVAQAEELSSSTDWSATASAYRELMRSWKQAGRADRTAEDTLWTRFKTAQDAFFSARAKVLDAKDRELREHAVAKEQLLAEAEKLLPVTDARAARSTLRGILERWEKAGSVPRDSQDRLEGGLRKIEEALRKAEDSHWRRTNPEALSRARGTVDQIRAAITQLEGQLAKAQAKGDAKAEQQAQEALEARRSWLTEAERTLAELSG
jgi:predicted  nucleic acid-binding Zn-ribbon protein